MKRIFAIGGKELNCEIVRTEQSEDTLFIEGKQIGKGWRTGEVGSTLNILESQPEFVKFLVETFGGQTQ